MEDDTYFQYKVVIDGEETTKYIAEDNLAATGQLRYNVKENDKGYIRKAELMTDVLAGGKDTHNVIALNGNSVITRRAAPSSSTARTTSPMPTPTST